MARKGKSGKGRGCLSDDLQLQTVDAERDDGDEHVVREQVLNCADAFMAIFGFRRVK